MVAPNIQLELSVREPVNAHSVRGADSGTDVRESSFAKELERAMNGADKTKQAEPVAQETKTASAGAEKAASPEELSLAKDEPLAARRTVVLSEDAVTLPLDKAGLIPSAEEAGRNLLGRAEVAGAENLYGLPLEGDGADKNPAAIAFATDDTGFALQKKPLDDGIASLSQLIQTEPSAVQAEVKARTGRKADENAATDEMLLAALQMEESVLPLADSAVLAADDAVAELPVEARTVRLESGTALDEKISVMDYRSAAENGVTDSSLQDGGFVTGVSHGEGNADITFNLAASSSAETLATDSSAGKEMESRFASMLSSQIQSSADEFVKTGSIVLRDGNMGTINLILHPEQLGNVKISLELHDKLVSAQISVASEEAFQALRESIPALKQAFAESGFQTGGFDLAWTGSGNGGNGQNQGENFSRGQMFSLAQAAYGDVFGDETADDLILEQKIYSDSARVAVNIMA